MSRKILNLGDLTLSSSLPIVASREMARRSFGHFVLLMHPNYVQGWFNQLICRKLEKFMHDVEEKKSPRLMLFTPVRHGKSVLASIMFPAWVLGHHPDWELISASHTMLLAEEFSFKTRTLLSSSEYQFVFPDTQIHPLSKAVKGWVTTANPQGSFTPAGVGTAIVGKGARIVGIDDPVSGAQAADSPSEQKATYDWYAQESSTRLAPGAGIFIIQQRWNDDDLSGRILRENRELREEHPGATFIENWEVLRFPFECEQDEYLTSDDKIIHVPSPYAKLVRKKGEPLHPQLFSRDEMLRIKYSKPLRVWSSIYQQNPTPEEGMYFKKDTFHFEPFPPPINQFPIYSAWDLALGTKTHNDWSVGLVASLDYDGRVHVLDMIRVKSENLDLARLMLDFLKPYADNLILTGIEQGASNLAVLPALLKNMRDRNFYLNLTDSLKPITDKRVRAKPAQDWLMAGNVIIPSPSSQPWVQTFLNELLSFDAGTNDDIVDAFAWLIRMIADQPSPRAVATKTHPDVKSWRERINHFVKYSSTHMGA